MDVRTADGRADRQTAGQWHGQMDERTVIRSVRQSDSWKEDRQTDNHRSWPNGPFKDYGMDMTTSLQAATQTNRQTDGRTDEWTHGRAEEQTNGLTDRRTHKQTDERTDNRTA